MKSYISHPIGGNTDLLCHKNNMAVDAWKRHRIALEPTTRVIAYEPLDYRGFDAPTYMRRLAGLLRLKADLEKMRDELEELRMCRKQAE